MRAGRTVGSANLRALLVDDAALPAKQLEARDDRRVTEVLVRDELGLCESSLGELRQAGRPGRETHLRALEVDLLGEQVRPSADH